MTTRIKVPKFTIRIIFPRKIRQKLVQKAELKNYFIAKAGFTFFIAALSSGRPIGYFRHTFGPNCRNNEFSIKHLLCKACKLKCDWISDFIYRCNYFLPKHKLSARGNRARGCWIRNNCCETIWRLLSWKL